MNGPVSWQALILLATFAVAVAFIVWRLCDAVMKIHERLTKLEARQRPEKE